MLRSSGSGPAGPGGDRSGLDGFPGFDCIPGEFEPTVNIQAIGDRPEPKEGAAPAGVGFLAVWREAARLSRPGTIPMLFNSFKFLYFFAAVYALYLILDKRWQNRLLLVASYYFYGCWDRRFLLLILTSTVIDYACGRGMGAAGDRPGLRKTLMRVSLASNLGILFVFKYFNFFTESLHTLLMSMGIGVDPRIISVALPVGVSFYTFQSINYTMAVYRGKLRPCVDFFDFALFIAFFPQLIAGPIERAEDLLPQVEGRREIRGAMVREGLWLILLGLFKKMVLADNMATLAGPVFDSPGTATGVGVLVGIYAFAFQIYGDFSGYSDIARGTAALMGFELMRNFRHPYFATNPSDFWRRWHVSLSGWLRDNLYIPLGGNRHGRAAMYRNLMITMLLGGIWHGASWNFVAWGLFHGILLVVYHISKGSEKTPAETSAPIVRVALVLAFFQVTCLGWILFAVRRLADVPTLLTNLFAPSRAGDAAGLL
ncbi:MBOAT family O-acyltransferase, partial [Singulisphaera rosea]